MATQFDQQRSDVVVVLGIVWTAGILMTLVVILAYVVVQTYDPTLSCRELGRKVHTTDGVPEDLDAWNDYELLCGMEPLS